MRHTTRLSLGIALLLSVLLHLAALPLVQPGREPQPQEPIPPIALETPQRLPRSVPTPRPTPTPHPKRTKPPTPAPPAKAHATLPSPPAAHTGPRPSVHVAHKTSGTRGKAPPLASTQTGEVKSGTGEAPGSGSGSAVEPAPSADQLNTPAVEPTQPPSCAQPNAPAITIETAEPQTPAIAAQQGISGDVTIVVSLDEASHVVDARVLHSPSTLLDAAALRAARSSTFRTELRDCRPIAADYAFIVEFTSQ